MRSRYLLLAGLIFTGGAQGVPDYAPTPGAAPGPEAYAYMSGAGGSVHMENPAFALRAGVDKLLAFLGGEPRPSEQGLADFLAREIAPFFDFEYMAESAGGRLFEQQGDEDRQAMIDAIKTSFLSKMAEKLGGFQDQQVRFLAPRAGNGGRTAQVSVAVLNPGRYPTRLDFRMYHNGEDWKVYDVAANGQSAIIHYRHQLVRQMNQSRMQRMRQVPPVTRAPGMPPMPYGPRPVR